MHSQNSYIPSEKEVDSALAKFKTYTTKQGKVSCHIFDVYSDLHSPVDKKYNRYLVDSVHGLFYIKYYFY